MIIPAIGNRHAIDTIHFCYESGCVTIKKHMEKAEEKPGEEKKSFLRVLKHQLKGPLTVTKGYLSFWETETYKKFPEEKQREFILKSLDGAKRMDLMLNDAFNALRLREKDVTPLPEAFDLKESVQKVCDAMQKKNAGKNVTLDIRLPDTTEGMMTDKASLETVVEKLIDNAYKFTNEGTISITVTQADGKTTIIVADPGKGFASEEQPQAFSPLFHGALSMFVIKGFTEDILRGTVTLASEGIDKGSVFTVIIPNTIQ